MSLGCDAVGLLGQGTVLLLLLLLLLLLRLRLARLIRQDGNDLLLFAIADPELEPISTGD